MIDLNDLQYRPLSAACKIGAFSCGHADIDKWFLKKSHADHSHRRSRVTTIHAGDDDEILAFFSLKITLEEEALLVRGHPMRTWAMNRMFPALHLEYLAVAKAHQGQQLGTIVMGHVLDLYHGAVQSLGVPVLTLVPVDDRTLRFYERLGFHAYAEHKGRRNMMLPGATVVDMFEKAREQT